MPRYGTFLRKDVVSTGTIQPTEGMMNVQEITTYEYAICKRSRACAELMMLSL
jgi:hypothetical protein